jgi:hypothetical protein
MKHDMEFILPNTNIPYGRVTSTARRGRKWFDLATAGDRLRFRFTETGEIFGRAAVVKVELVTLAEVFERATENHAAEGVAESLARDVLTVRPCRGLWQVGLGGIVHHGSLHPVEQ